MNDSVKDCLNDLESDITLYKSFEDFQNNKSYLLHNIKKIKVLLGLEEDEEEAYCDNDDEEVGEIDPTCPF